MRIPSEALFAAHLKDKRQDAPSPSSSTPPPTSTPSTSSSASPTTSPTSSPSPSPAPSSSGSSSTKTVAIVVAIAAALLIVNIAVFFYLRKIRRRNPLRRDRPTYWLQSHLPKWNFSTPFSKGKGKGKGSYSPSLQRSELSSSLGPTDDNNNSSNDATTANNTRRPNTVNAVETAQRASTASTVARGPSIRSIMTLPAYTPAAAPNERILGREGDRAGIDTVLEFPETSTEEEARREEEMESLYQIRLQRRREHAARDERRRLRREARARGDMAEVNRLRRESRLAPGQAAAMIVEHQTRGRERRVSSVSYAGAGVARHDGSRLRATSEDDSDRNPLLAAAAAPGGGHRRGRSETSLGTTVTVEDDDDDDDDYEVLTLAQTRTRASSNAASSTAGEDLGEARIPLVDPPEYVDVGGFEDAPPYESPVEQRRRSLLPRIEHLPEIEVTVSSPGVEGREQGEWVGREVGRS